MRRKPPPGNARCVHSNGQTTVGVFVNKCGRTIQFESFAERIFFLRLDRDLRVRDYQSQPETLVFTDAQGQQHHYTPDVQVWKHDGSIELHEITRSERAEKPSLQQRAAAARQICAERGWCYVLQTETTLPTATEAANLQFLATYTATSYVHPLVMHLAQQRALTQPRLLLRDLHATIVSRSGLPSGVVCGALCHLLWHHTIEADLRPVLLFIDQHPHPAAWVWFPERMAADAFHA